MSMTEIDFVRDWVERNKGYSLVEPVVNAVQDYLATIDYPDINAEVSEIVKNNRSLHFHAHLERSNTEKKLEELEEAFCDLQSESLQMEKENQVLHIKMTRLAMENRALKKNVEALEKASSNKGPEGLEEDYCYLVDRNIHLEKEIAVLNKENRRLSEESRKLERKVENLEKANSSKADSNQAESSTLNLTPNGGRVFVDPSKLVVSDRDGGIYVSARTPTFNKKGGRAILPLVVGFDGKIRVWVEELDGIPLGRVYLGPQFIQPLVNSGDYLPIEVN